MKEKYDFKKMKGDKNMQAFISAPTALLIVGAISIIVLYFGFSVSKKMKGDSDEFLYAGRNVGLALSTATLIAAWVTGNTTMSAPEQGYTLGLIASIAYSLAGLSLAIFAPLSLRIKKIMPDGCTSGDFIRVRYGKKVWITFLIMSVWYFLGFLMTQAMAGGILLQALSGLDYKVGMLFVMIVCTLYTLKGGLKAILSTDFLLSLVIMIVLLFTSVLAFSKFGVSEIYRGVMEIKPSLMNTIPAAGLMYLGSNFLFACGEVFHSNIWWQRIYASSEKVAARSFIISGLIWTTVPIIAGSLAFIAVANNYIVPQVNMVFPIVVSNLLGPIGAVLVLVVIYSALISTVSSVLTSSANLLVQDIYKNVINKDATDDEIVKYVKYVIVGLAILSIILVWTPKTSMYQLLLLTGPAVASLVWPITYGIFNREVNKTAVFIGCIGGMISGLLGYFFISSYVAPIFSCVVSGIFTIGGTKLYPDKNFRWRDLNDAMKVRVVENE